MTLTAQTYRDCVSMQPLLGSADYSSFSFTGTGGQSRQKSSIVVIADIINEGKTLKISPFSPNCEDVCGRADKIGKSALLATVELVGKEKVRLTAFSPMMKKLSAGTVDVVINGTEKSLGKVSIRKSLDQKEYKFLLDVFNANKNRIGG